EMQREKQHMRIVIDEYGGVAGLVTIEDLMEAIVGSIADEHDETEALEEPVREPDGSYVVPGSFEVSRLRELFADQIEAPQTPAEEAAATEPYATPNGLPRVTLHLPQDYEATTIGVLGSEHAGQLPLSRVAISESG